MSAATRVIAAQGLGAATATIAREAGVSNGSLFTYFETKADLLNQLYLELKADMGTAALGGLPSRLRRLGCRVIQACHRAAPHCSDHPRRASPNSRASVVA